MTTQKALQPFAHKNLLDTDSLSTDDIMRIIKLAHTYVDNNHHKKNLHRPYQGYTLMNLFVENSTRTQKSFELAGKRLGMDVINLLVDGSSIKKGETLLDTAITLNAMNADVLVLRHPEAGASELLSLKCHCHIINAGDGCHQHPTQALLDVATIYAHKKTLLGLNVAICGDIYHSRVARSNINLLQKMGARVRVIAPLTLLPTSIEYWGVEVFHDMEEGIHDCDIVMMLRLQKERMNSSYLPSMREYFYFYGLTNQKLKRAKDDVLVMHPGPMNRGIEIDSDVADNMARSVIFEQVNMGVAVRMACLDLLLQQSTT